MICPLCGARSAKRSCPALRHEICAVCCGTKRLTNIPCPGDCRYLATAREHPPAIVIRRKQRDLGLLREVVRDYNERQWQLFMLLATFLARAAAERSFDVAGGLIDDDVAEAMRALASTYETAVRGVIYDHRPASFPAQRVVSELKPLLTEAGKTGGTAFERDAAVVTRGIERAVGELRADHPSNPRAFVELLGRLLVKEPGAEGLGESPPPERPRLIRP